jgi:predicted dehydrogenase
LSDYFKITYLCDISEQALFHCAGKITGEPPQTTTSAEELIQSSDVDLVFVCSAHDYHSQHVILALQHDKPVFVEKPMCMTLRDADAIIQTEKRSKGWVMVGYMRRYASAFTAALKEIEAMERISYARVRGSIPRCTNVDIIGPNSYFVTQSATFPKSFQVVEEEDILNLGIRQLDMLEQGLTKECGIQLTPTTIETWKILNV